MQGRGVCLGFMEHCGAIEGEWPLKWRFRRGECKIRCDKPLRGKRRGGWTGGVFTISAPGGRYRI